ncbi:EcsC family protein [Lederbergia sp. NSJ-179]|uniref:EcsC family protein n=1 Tax=Lederbergia sp. NSJ-179 TaxID=2931402 RepID=UPI001FD1B6B5|nr:EcsC family protein [Lederbergia sp. NSJ-179]MCJ7843487.1 EcsC family protein [Lederbergia sp. NSJ-179]
MMETTEQLLVELKKCGEWEKDQNGLWFWEKIGRLPFKLLDKLTPAFLQRKIGVILDELGQYIQSGGRYLSSVSSLKSYYPHKNIRTLEDLDFIPIAEMDHAVSKLKNNRKRLATFQGASTGIGGIITLSIDIPLLLGLQLKILQDIAICYGYNPNDKKERVYIVKILQFVSSDIVGKQAILKQLSLIDSTVQGEKRDVISELQGWREVVMTYRDQIGWKKVFQMIPIAGLIFGAFINRSAVNNLSEAGMMLYRKRRIKERLGQYDHHTKETDVK